MLLDREDIFDLYVVGHLPLQAGASSASVPSP